VDERRTHGHGLSLSAVHRDEMALLDSSLSTADQCRVQIRWTDPRSGSWSLWSMNQQLVKGNGN
jgi:hypothetical protein